MKARGKPLAELLHDCASLISRVIIDDENIPIDGSRNP